MGSVAIPAFNSKRGTQNPAPIVSAANIAVIDTGICNLRSVTKALEAVGASIRVVHAPGEIAAMNARGLVLPGVGALRDCVASLRASGLDATVRDWIAADKPFLGVCLGMQALFERSEEGGVTGLGVFSPVTDELPGFGRGWLPLSPSTIPAPALACKARVFCCASWAASACSM